MSDDVKLDFEGRARAMELETWEQESLAWHCAAVEAKLAAEHKQSRCYLDNWNATEKGYNEVDARRVKAERELVVEKAANAAVRDACFEQLPECQAWGDVPGCIAELKRELAEANKRADADEERLRYLGNDPFCDEYGGIDLHEQATIYASASGRAEPDSSDYLAACRAAIDEARKE